MHAFFAAIEAIPASIAMRTDKDEWLASTFDRHAAGGGLADNDEQQLGG
jgi:hypothetical protein